MSGLSLINDTLRINPSVDSSFLLGKMPQQGEASQLETAGFNLGAQADLSEEVRFVFDGRAGIANYYEFNRLKMLNPQFPLVNCHDGPADSLLVQFKLPEAKIEYRGPGGSLSFGYQKVVLGSYEFPLAPANSFSGADFSTPDQFPVYRSLLGAREELNLGDGASMILIMTPSWETRNIMPFQTGQLKAGLPVGNVVVNNQPVREEIGGLLGWRAALGKENILIGLNHSHDHFFRIKNVALDPARNEAAFNLIYPYQETALAELNGAHGNLVYWLQGNLAYHPFLSETATRWSHQAAAGIKYFFPEQYAFAAAQVFQGSLLGNGELDQTVASLKGGLQMLNGDLKIGGLVNGYFNGSRPKLEANLSLTYLPTPDLSISLGGHWAQPEVFTLAQPVYGYLGLGYRL